MCELVTGALILGGLSTAMGAFSSIQQGKQQAAQANYQAMMAAQNAQTADQNAKQVEETGRAEEQRARIIAGQKTGAMRAQAAASGFDVSSESFTDDFAASDVMGDYDSRAIRNQYQTQANAYHTQAGDFASQVGMYNKAGQNAITNGAMGALGSVIGGASQMAFMGGAGAKATGAGVNKPMTTDFVGKAKIATRVKS